MIAALQALQRNYEALSSERNAMTSMQISSKGSLMALLSTHPQLDKRIERLQSEM
jgi:Zn-dependent protease with chaperone function